MKCLDCGATMKTERKSIPYEMGGLPQFVLKDVEIRTCPACGERETVIERIEILHHTIAAALIGKHGPLTGNEIRFLRKALGWSGDDFARHAGVRPETVSRWENDKEIMGPTAERFLRLAVAQWQPVQDYTIEQLDRVAASKRPAPLRGQFISKKANWTFRFRGAVAWGRASDSIGSPAMLASAKTGKLQSVERSNARKPPRKVLR